MFGISRLAQNGEKIYFMELKSRGYNGDNYTDKTFTGGYKVYIEDKSTGRSEEAVYHEVYHTFQFDNLGPADKLRSFLTQYGAFPYESSARYVGAKFLHDDWDQIFDTYVKIRNGEKGKLDSFTLTWLDRLPAYHEHLSSNIDFLSQSIFDTENKYFQCGLMAYFQEKLPGDKFLIDYVRKINESDFIFSQREIKTLDQTVISYGYTLTKVFPDYITTAYYGQYWGLDSRAEGSFFMKKNIQLTPPVALTWDISRSQGSGNVKVDASTTTIKNQNIKCLSGKYYKLDKVDQAITKNGFVKIRRNTNDANVVYGLIPLNASGDPIYTDANDSELHYLRLDSGVKEQVFKDKNVKSIVVAVANGAWQNCSSPSFEIEVVHKLFADNLIPNKVNKSELQTKSFSMGLTHATPASQVKAVVMKLDTWEDGNTYPRRVASVDFEGLNLQDDTGMRQTGTYNLAGVDLPPGQYSVIAEASWLYAGGDFSTASTDSQGNIVNVQSNALDFEIIDDGSNGSLTLDSVTPAGPHADESITLRGKGFKEGQSYTLYFSDFDGGFGLSTSISDVTTVENTETGERYQRFTVQVPHAAVRGPIYATDGQKNSNELPLDIVPKLDDSDTNPTCSGCTITVSGSGFYAGMTLYFAGSAVEAEVNSANSVTVKIPDNTPPDTYPLEPDPTDTTPGGGGGTPGGGGGDPGGGNPSEPIDVTVVELAITRIEPQVPSGQTGLQAGQSDKLRIYGIGFEEAQVTAVFKGKDDETCGASTSGLINGENEGEKYVEATVPRCAVDRGGNITATAIRGGSSVQQRDDKTSTITIEPFLESLSPSTGSIQSTFKIQGTGLWKASQVKLGSYVLSSDAYTVTDQYNISVDLSKAFETILHPRNKTVKA